MVPTNFEICRPAEYKPSFLLENRNLPWQPSKSAIFGREVGIEARPIADISESSMAVCAVHRLFNEQELDRSNCRGLVVASSSLAPQLGGMLPPSQELTPDFETIQSRWGKIEEATQAIDRYLGGKLDAECVVGINWGCSSFPRAVEKCIELGQSVQLKGKEYILLVTTNRLSQVMDWKKASAAIFGDSATACALSLSGALPCGIEIRLAKAQMNRVSDVNFSCTTARSIQRPHFSDGALTFQPCAEDIGLLSMTPPVIARHAPDLLVEISTAALADLGLTFDAIDHWVPHQAGRKIVNKFVEIAGVDGARVFRAFERCGNLTSSSIPHALRHAWRKLTGSFVACPSVGAGAVGTPSMTSGIVVLGRADGLTSKPTTG